MESSLCGSPKEYVTVVGFSHKSMGCRVVGFARQLKRCAISCGAWLHEGQKSKVYGMILALQLLGMLTDPDISWARMVLVTRGSCLSFSAIGGGCRFITLLWMSSSMVVVRVVWCRERCASLTDCRFTIVGMRGVMSML